MKKDSVCQEDFGWILAGEFRTFICLTKQARLRILPRKMNGRVPGDNMDFPAVIAGVSPYNRLKVENGGYGYRE